ncbi:MAG: hypothetical protein ACYC56_07520 [Candidatus Aquicultor sp.]
MNIHTKVCVFGIVGALLLSSVFLTACSGSNEKLGMDLKSGTALVTEQKTAADSKSPASSIDPLTLITKADAEALLGERIKEPEGSNGDESLGQQIVIYGADSEASFKTVTFSLVRTADIAKEERDKGQDAAHAFITTKEQFPAAKPVPGIGGSAFWDGSQGGWTGLNVLSKDTFFTIKVNLGTDVTSDTVELNAEKGLALKVLERLPK